MYSTETIETFFQLVRLGIGNEASKQVVLSKNIDYVQLKALADSQGLSGVVLDGVEKCHTETTENTDILPLKMKLEWIGEVLQNFEQRYKAYEKAISSLAGFYNHNGFKMMVLKGYACSLDWPKPEHRPMGDIDIWLFGKQHLADEVMERETGIKVNNSHHHHTVFLWHGFMVENHYDFINIHHHRSNVKLDKELKRLAADDSNEIVVNGERLIVPSPNFHSFFLLRHAMNHFASEVITLRQLLDWGFFAQKHRALIDWDWLNSTMEKHGLKRLYDIFNSILMENLGLPLLDKHGLKMVVPVDESLKNRVLSELLSPDFSKEEPKSIIPRVIYKYRRWRSNEWKHKLCYQDSMYSAFWSGVLSHLLKPSSI